jgi:hypothetical protein
VPGRSRTVTAPGDWHVSDDGKYCVHIEWKSRTENWCVPVQQKMDGKYTLVQDSNSGASPQDEITK